ncbi:MAG: hypothetical protein KGZ63_08425 [Clostridiales bacterium]|jgi:hypothetical protein|nr:hypothetical protein [Clostridiales bacterium]
MVCRFNVKPLCYDGISLNDLHICGDGSGRALIAGGIPIQNVSIINVWIEYVEDGLHLIGESLSNPLKNFTMSDVLISEVSGTPVTLWYTDGVNINLSSFSGYPGQALISEDALIPVDAKHNWWGGMCPGNVISGNVEFSPWAVDASFSGFISEQPACLPTETGDNVTVGFNLIDYPIDTLAYTISLLS